MTKVKRCVSAILAVGAVMALTGCSGINYTHGVSPATFLLPGLVNNEEPESDTESVSEETAYVRVVQNL